MSDPTPGDKLHLTGPVKDEEPNATESNPVGETIGMEARVMLKSVRLPSTRPLPQEIREQIRKTAGNHIRHNKLTFREVSKQIGVGESTVSEVIKGTYKRANPDPILEKLNVWIDDDERRRRKTRPLGFYPTCVFDAIKGLAKYAKSNARIPEANKHPAVAHDPPRITVGWGPAGCGKSIGAQALHAEDPLSILVRIEQRRGTDTGLAKLIIESAGWRGRPVQASTIEFVMRKLRDSGRLLIVDEAHRLKTSGCELLRDLADVCGIPVLLLATREIYDRLTRVRTRSGEVFYDQFSRRVGYVVDLVRGLDGKGGVKRPIYSLEEVRTIFKADNVRVTADGIEYLCAVACTIGLGMLGEAANIFEKALRSALRRDRVIDASLLRKAARSVLLPAGDVNDEVLLRIEQTLEANRAVARRAEQRVASG